MAERLLLTCEHGGNRIPVRFAPCFARAQGALRGHQGWDPGALDLARHLARRLAAPLLATRVSRLLVDTNRSLHHPFLFSRFSARLSEEERRLVVARHWLPHRTRVELAVARHIARGERVLHLALHSFTPMLRGSRRRFDVGLLYDPARGRERALCRRWQALLARTAPELAVRRNQPYRGVADGLTTALRCRFPGHAYLGIELEVNQRRLRADAPGRLALRRAIETTLRELLETPPQAARPRSSPRST